MPTGRSGAGFGVVTSSPGCGWMSRVPAWTTDLRDVPPPDAGIAAAVRDRGLFVVALVEAATSRDTNAPWTSAVQCIARRGRAPCKSRVEVTLSTAEIAWSCPGCGESGVITHFDDTQADLSVYQPVGRTVWWGFGDEERDVLRTATTHIAELRAIVSRARPHTEAEGLLYLEATVEELDDMYSLVEELTDGTRSRRRIELLDGLRASLCTSMDGF